MTIFNLSSIHVYTSKGIPLIIESAQWCGVFNPSTVLFVSKATLFFSRNNFTFQKFLNSHVNSWDKVFVFVVLVNFL